MAKAMRVSPLTPRLGAEIEGVDICRLDDADFDRLRRCWLDYKVIFLRGQRVSLDDLLRFSQRFGELMRLPYIEPHEDYPEIIRVLKRPEETDMGVFGGEWHSDFSFLAEPPSASILYAEEVPTVGGDTLWIDMGQALRALPDEQRRLLRGKIAIHSGKPYGVANAPDESVRVRGSINIERGNPEADRETKHPAICRHPQTGEEILFVNPTYTTRIDGLPAAESARLLQDLYRHCARPEFGCRFRWTAGSIALWDNRSTLHYAVNDYDGERRCLYRTTVAGTAPVAA